MLLIDVHRYPACRFPSTTLVNALLKVGADVNALDDSGSTPLHVAARSRPCPSAMVQALLAYGAHLDAIDGNGNSFAKLLSHDQPLHKICNPLRHTTLACLAARTVRTNNIPFVGAIPKHLEPFVLQH